MLPTLTLRCMATALPLCSSAKPKVRPRTRFKPITPHLTVCALRSEATSSTFSLPGRWVKRCAPRAHPSNFRCKARSTSVSECAHTRRTWSRRPSSRTSRSRFLQPARRLLFSTARLRRSRSLPAIAAWFTALPATSKRPTGAATVPISLQSRRPHPATARRRGNAHDHRHGHSHALQQRPRHFARRYSAGYQRPVAI